jgi:nicotinamide riboside transporter PnuC
MNKKYLLILEIIWIITGVLCVVFGIRYAIKTGGSTTFLFVIMATISFLFAWFRHSQRKKG